MSMSKFRAYLNKTRQLTFSKIPRKAAQNRADFSHNCTESGNRIHCYYSNLSQSTSEFKCKAFSLQRYESVYFYVISIFYLKNLI